MKLSNPGVERTMVSSEKQTRMWYEAPEVSDGKRELKSDVWSLGVTVFELAKKESPFKVPGILDADNHINNNDPSSFSNEKWSIECVEFARKCLVRDVKKRWSVKQLMEVSHSGLV